MAKTDNAKFTAFVMTVVTTLAASGIVALFNLAVTVVRLDERVRNLDCGKQKRAAAAKTPERQQTVLGAVGFGFVERLFQSPRKDSRAKAP